jgi:hypothetical protein
MKVETIMMQGKNAREKLSMKEEAHKWRQNKT